MTNDEMQVLRALEIALDYVEDSWEYGVTRSNAVIAHMEQIKNAIEVVKRWETKE